MQNITSLDSLLISSWVNWIESLSIGCLLSTFYESQNSWGSFTKSAATKQSETMWSWTGVFFSTANRPVNPKKNEHNLSGWFIVEYLGEKSITVNVSLNTHFESSPRFQQLCILCYTGVGSLSWFSQANRILTPNLRHATPWKSSILRCPKILGHVDRRNPVVYRVL